MRKLVGPHLAGQWANKLDIVRQWQPPLCVVLSPEVDKVKQLRAACPDTIIIGRFYHEDSWYAEGIRNRPETFALNIHEEIVSNPVTPLLDYVQTNNEVCQDWSGIGQLNTFTKRWMHLADESQVYKCAILAFSEGNPDLPNKPGDPAGFDGRMLYWQQVLPSLNYAQRNGHILLLHAYGWPDLFHPDADWHIYRYERQVQANLRTLGITNLKYAYGEIGIDKLIVGEKGGYKAVPTSDQDCVNQFLQWERDQQGQSLLLGGAVYTFGDSGGWGSYDITSTDAAAYLAMHYDDHADQYGPDAVVKKEKKFMPFVGTGTPAPTREWDPRLTARGVTVQTPPIAPGQQFWRVAKARWLDKQEAGGRHGIFGNVYRNGRKEAGVQLLVTWPSDKTFIKTEDKSGDPPPFDYWYNYQMSPSLNEFSVEVAQSIPSERVSGIGMGFNGNPNEHTSTAVDWELTTMPQATQPTPPPPPAVEPPPVGVPSMPTGIIAPRVAQAILQIESGDRAFGDDGRPVIRFEAHIFKSRYGNDALWADHFRTDAVRPWVDQMWRRGVGDPWKPIHTGKQADEYAAFEFASGINPDAAAQSISMGAAQIMGFNHARIGYPTAQAMLQAFESEPMQIIGFVNYFLSDPALIDAARRRDWRAIAAGYNGAGNVDQYAKLLQQAYEASK